jgi:hypothetical protein
VSDPNIFSTAQRIAQAQAVLEMARSAPQLHDLYQAYKRMYEAIRIPNIDEILKKPEDAVQMDPIDENMSVLYGKPIRAFPEQDHESHIAVHIQFLQDPSLAGNPGAKAMQPVLMLTSQSISRSCTASAWRRASIWKCRQCRTSKIQTSGSLLSILKWIF